MKNKDIIIKKKKEEGGGGGGGEFLKDFRKY